MGLFGPQRREFYGITGAEDLIPGRAYGGSRAVGNVVVTDDRAMRQSVVWACTSLRAGLVSTFPVDQYRDVLGVQTEYSPKPIILTDPGGVRTDIVDWLAMSQMDLDRAGNAVGLIVERSTARSRYHPKGLPSRIELQPTSACAYVKRDGVARWRIDGKFYDPSDVYHERANLVSGFELGLPTIVYAAAAIGESMSMQEFGTDWFRNGGVPKAQLKNTAKKLEATDVVRAKQWYRDVVDSGDALVTGADWEYKLIQGEYAGNEFIEGRKLAASDICRFMGTPADLVDVQASSGGSITYANITQRNVQFLIYHLGPAVQRREKELTKLLPTPRYVKLNTDALLRMDPETRQKVLRSRINARLLTNSEGRKLENLQPLTAADLAEFEAIYGPPKGATPAGESESADVDRDPVGA